MDVQFITTTSAQLDNLPIVNGQIIAVYDELGYYYDMNNQRFPVASSGTYFGTSTGQAANQAKTATLTISDDMHFELHAGTMVGIKFDADNTFVASSANPITLNVNSTGAKPIYATNTTTLPGTSILYYGKADYVIYYMYDGTNWVWAGTSADSDTIYTPQTLGFGYGTCTSAESTSAKVASLSSYQLISGGFVSIRFSNGVKAGDTLNINSKGAIPMYYKNAAITDGVISGGDTATFVYDGSKYHLVSLDSGTGSGGGGHVIEDAEGTALAQRDTLQFAGYLKATDDSTNSRTVVSDAPTEITWTAYNQLTPAQKAGVHWLISGAPGTLPSDEAIFKLTNQSLTFTNKVATITDSRITASTYPFIFWSDSTHSAAEAAIITCVATAGTLTFTATNDPSETLVCDVLFIAPALADPVNLSDLLDVLISNPADGQTLVYDATAGKWVNKKVPASYIVTVPTTGYTYASVSAWGETKMLYTKYITTDKDGTSMTDFRSGMNEDIPLHVTGSQSDFGKLFSYSISNGGINIFMIEVPSAAFNILVREAV